MSSNYYLIRRGGSPPGVAPRQLLNNNIVNNNNNNNDINRRIMVSNSKLIHFMKYLKEEHEAHNYRQVKVLLDGSKHVRNMMDDISHVQNKQVRNWIYKCSKPHTMFLQ